MAGVSYLSSAGIRVFLSLEKELRKRGGRISLCAARPAVIKVLELTGFDRFFLLCPGRDEALDLLRRAERPAGAGQNLPAQGTMHTRISAEPFPDHEAVLQLTGNGGRCGAGAVTDADPVPRVFARDEYSLGTGTPEGLAEEPRSGLGDMVTAGGAIFWRPSKSSDPPDFLIPRNDAPPVPLSTLFSVSMDGRFHEILVAEPVDPAGVRLADLARDIFLHARAAREDCPPVIALVLYAGCGGDKEAAGTPSPGAGQTSLHTTDRTLVAVGICIDTAADLSGYDHDALGALLGREAPDPGTKDLFMYMAGLVFDAAPDPVAQDLARLVAVTAAEERCTGLVRIAGSTLLSRTVVGVSYISGIVRTDRMPVRVRGECPGWNRTFETIARRLHHGCREIELVPLTGGFSGTLVFRVNARDHRGKLMMPLVMKLGSWPVIGAEIRGYTDHVKRYIQNNATQVIEQARIGDFGGILYNFVGIRGAESRIFSLEDFYLTRPANEVLPVFDSLFAIMMKGWYEEPEKKEMALYREYNRFWNYDGIRAYAASQFHVMPDDEEVDLPFGLGRSVNPLWFVEHVIPGRLNAVFSCYESSVHGDLNMKNVLMDETGNLWLIDFSDTRYSHILRDIVKLEAVITGEMVPLASREMLARLVRADLPFLSQRSLSSVPLLADSPGDPALEKAFLCIRKLREYADRITPGDDDITQYYLGLLPYTLNLLSYTSTNGYQKEFGWIAASLICRQLMREGAYGTVRFHEHSSADSSMRVS
jgi:hypothetical protein